VSAPDAPPSPSDSRGVLRRAGPSLLLNAACPWAAYQILTALGIGAVPAITATTAFPIAGTLVGWVRSGRPDVFGLLAVLFIALSVAVAVATDNPLVILLRGSVANAAFALLCFGSLAFGRPLMFYAARQLMAGWDRAASAGVDVQWAQPGFRQTMRRITVVWGGWFVVQAIGRIAAIQLVPVSTYLAAWPIVSALGTIAMISWSVSYGRRSAARRAWDPVEDGARLGGEARAALDRAGAEAKRFRQRYVGTEHLLVALCQDETTAARALKNAGVTAGGARATLEMWAQAGKTPAWREPEYAPRLHTVLRRADDARRAAGASHVGTEHLLFGLAAEEDGQAAFLLKQMGVDLSALRERLLGFRDRPPDAPSS
jgi:hypothetical protein